MSCNHCCCQQPCKTVSNTITVHITNPAAFADEVRKRQMTDLGKHLQRTAR